MGLYGSAGFYEGAARGGFALSALGGSARLVSRGSGAPSKAVNLVSRLANRGATAPIGRAAGGVLSALIATPFFAALLASPFLNASLAFSTFERLRSVEPLRAAEAQTRRGVARGRGGAAGGG